MKTRIYIAVLILILLVSCAPSNASTFTQTAITLEASSTSAPSTKTPINTRTAMAVPTLTSLPTTTATNTPKPFLIAYSYGSDGGDDLVRCIQEDTGNPRFILYQDGVLIRHGQPYYLQSQLSQTEIDKLMDEITKTGLFQEADSKYQAGNSALVINGKTYFVPYDLPEEDPLRKALEVILSFQSQNATKFVPQNLLLMVFSVFELDDIIKNWLPEPNPVFQTWQQSPLARFKEGWFTITGEDVPMVMEQFPGFPGFRVFQDDNSKRYYVAAICTIYPYR